ncbi:LacI family DNA-binding transcriptional regulator [Virgibacillus alimentarius]|uniref:LacI family transcriptional regulator n=1 Tax=Virgibacillus alimentarius TaxID=698769 RepID=A0ABS4S8J7_9BACI|nr:MULTISPECIES: LacI family DNA-binding transcriptional regulator [Virgibacillus]MBP2257811.1 LacI family transcriptional regulator [Virgibacillus alimentarius]HLR67674.1 LacI family DNA-binding transcriptional regulator [Virgibacillus sp.]
MRDVAKFADVSVATVSRVINGKGDVNPETRKRVEQAIEYLHYKPNDVARTLFRGKSKMIALFVPDIMNPFFPELARAVEDVTNKYNYTFILCNTDGDLEKELTYIDTLQQKAVDGFIIVSSTITDEMLKKISVPIIALDRFFHSELASITVDNYQGGREATEYLQSIGCQRIAHLCGPESASNTMERLRGYMDVVRDTDWFLSSYLLSCNYNMEQAKVMTMEMLRNHPEIDGIFAANDVMAIGAMKAAEQLGIRIPEDLAVIGFDGISVGEATSPTLTTMAQPIYDMGTRAAEMLMEQIQTQVAPKTIETFPVHLLERESTKRKKVAHG